MKFPFIKIFRSQPGNIPEHVKTGLSRYFPDAINIDWEHKKNIFEAVFYLNDVEHIARFSKKGELIEFKKNLWINELPKTITDKCKKEGEIMNIIAINRGKNQFFEVIIRDLRLKRKLLLFDQSASLISSHKL